MRQLLAAVGVAVAVRHAHAEVESEAADGGFSLEACSTLVTDIQKANTYSELEIRDKCGAKLELGAKCDFLAEALSLAAPHPDFSPDQFCSQLSDAVTCSTMMDKLLSSSPVGDLAFGECMRTQQKKGVAYCTKFRDMLGMAVSNSDLDTIRACYLVEAFGAEGATPISHAKSKLDDFGKGAKGTAGHFAGNGPATISTPRGDLNEAGVGKAKPTTVPATIVATPMHAGDFHSNGTKIAPAPKIKLGQPQTQEEFGKGAQAPGGHFSPAPAASLAAKKVVTSKHVALKTVHVVAAARAHQAPAVKFHGFLSSIVDT